MTSAQSVELIATKILMLRGQRVMLDKDLAKLYGVSVGRLNEQVNRNIKRFPQDFMFLLTRQEVMSLRSQFAISNIEPFTAQEVSNLRSQIVTSNDEHLAAQEVKNLRFHYGTSKRGGRRYLPYAFTEQGVAMLTSDLNSERAIRVNIMIMRAFVKLKELLLTHKDLAEKIAALEKKYDTHDEKIQLVFEAIKQLLEPPPEPKKPPIGFSKE
ncbi:MAG: ORF6N domain-containing protein [Candidatus Omnitrophica bacterium]|nr:ORF6N domain-containing protein [Candidatus Omnitrophota bacterium]